MGKQPDADRIRAAANAANARDGSPPLKRPSSKSTGTPKTPSSNPPGGGAKPPATGSRLPVPASGRAMKPHVLEGEFIPKKNVPAKPTPKIERNTIGKVAEFARKYAPKAAAVTGAVARGAASMARRHPAALAATAVGGALLASSSRKAPSTSKPSNSSTPMEFDPQSGAPTRIGNTSAAPKSKTNTPLPTKPKASAPKPKASTPKPAAPKSGFSQDLKNFAASERAALQNDPRAKKKDPATFKPRSSGIKRGPSVFQS